MQGIARTLVDRQAELNREIEPRRSALGVRVHDQLVEFERGIVSEQRKLKTSVRAFLARLVAARGRAATKVRRIP